jgi:hypothetical protein
VSSTSGLKSAWRRRIEATLTRTGSPEPSFVRSGCGYRRLVASPSAGVRQFFGVELRPVGLEPTLGFMLRSGLAAEPVNVEAVDGVEVTIDTYARSTFEDTRRKAQKFGARGTALKAYKPGG